MVVCLPNKWELESSLEAIRFGRKLHRCLVNFQRESIYSKSRVKQNVYLLLFFVNTKIDLRLFARKKI